MKMLKLALLGGAALAVISASAQADELSDLKAQMEALNARVAQMEASPAVPTGYSLLTVSEADQTVVPGLNVRDTKDNIYYSKQANVISVLPTADAPAATTIEWSGYVRAIVNYTDYNYAYGDKEVHINTRAQLKVVAKTDTAVGEVGVRIGLRAQASDVNVKGAFVSNEHWGWWAMTPELTFGGGYSGSLGNIGYGVDGSCNCYGTDWWSNTQRGGSATYAPNPGDASQIRLSYASGPMSMAIALEDSDVNGNSGDLAVAAEMAYSGDAFSGEISGIFWQNDTAPYGDGWQAGIGGSAALGDVLSLSVAAAMGQNSYNGNYWLVSGLASAQMTDQVHGEIGASYSDYTDLNDNIFEALAGIYYEPVSQLTFGLEGEYTELPNGWYADDKFWTFDFVSVWRF